MKLKLYRLSLDAQIPAYAHDADSGLDLVANETLSIPSGEWRVVGTGVVIALPLFTEAQIRPRSGLAAKYGLTVLNTPGTIDEGYRGEIKVILINHSQQDFLVEKGMKIAQMVIAPVLRPVIEISEGAIEETDRGQNGFGSTGLS